jgi:hypothetical protein
MSLGAACRIVDPSLRQIQPIGEVVCANASLASLERADLITACSQ